MNWAGNLWAIHGGGFYYLEIQGGPEDHSQTPALVQITSLFLPG